MDSVYSESTTKIFGIKMQEIKFTVEQVNQLLNALGELSFKQAAPIIQFVRDIAEPQVASQAVEAETKE